MACRRIVVTGVSRGLGRALVHELDARGHAVAGCARTVEAVAQLAREYPPPHGFHAVDVARDSQVRDWAHQVLQQHGPPDLLINNAALINASDVLWKVPPAEFSTLIDVNIKGVYHVLRHFLPAMLAARRGIVVNFSSTWGRSTSPEVTPYCASKWAIEGLTRGLAQELPRGMAAVALNPGVIHTEMLESCFGTLAASYPSPRQWAVRAAPFLLELSSRNNGEALTVPD
jgi:NAD(P)-dependent dehydrogenase (short-subunit alcohol dehydrogenase family)